MPIIGRHRFFNRLRQEPSWERAWPVAFTQGRSGNAARFGGVTAQPSRTWRQKAQPRAGLCLHRVTTASQR